MKIWEEAVEGEEWFPPTPTGFRPEVFFRIWGEAAPTHPLGGPWELILGSKIFSVFCVENGVKSLSGYPLSTTPYGRAPTSQVKNPFLNKNSVLGILLQP